MADDKSFAEKTEPATPKRREELRKKGQVAKSMEVPSAMGLIGGTLIIYILGGELMKQLGETIKQYLSLSPGTEINQANIVNIVGAVTYRFLLLLLPILVVLMIVGVVSNVAQFGFLFTLKPLTEGKSKMNPLNGIKKLGFSQTSMIELTKSIFKVLIVSVVGYFAIKQLIIQSAQLVDSSPAEIFSFMGTGAFAVAMKIAAVFALLAAGDFYTQRKKFQHESKMTKEEVKEEMKRDEGDPKIKGRMRREMVKRHRMRMMSNVPRADVVITNPTHYAIAIQYDSQKMAAPKVLAKGKDLIAQKIKEIAAEHNIPIVEDKPLAQLLFRTVEIDEQIPPDLFKAVAQILAYIYQMKKMKRGYGKN